MSVKQIVGEFPSRKRIEEFLGIEIAASKFGHDLIWIARDIQIFDLNQGLGGIQHGLIRFRSRLLGMTTLQGKLRFEQFPFGGRQTELNR